jgi:hypothetical protein
MLRAFGRQIFGKRLYIGIAVASERVMHSWARERRGRCINQPRVGATEERLPWVLPEGRQPRG